jgi:hypothetical protein
MASVKLLAAALVEAILYSAGMATRRDISPFALVKKNLLNATRTFVPHSSIGG